MQRHAPLLLAIALCGCGLDDFSWGGPKEEICSVEWRMTISGPEGADLLNPEIRDVVFEGERNVTWEADYGPHSPTLHIRDLFFDEPLYMIVRGGTVEQLRVSGPCERSVTDSEIRTDPLRTYTCQVAGSAEGVEHRAELVLREVDHCE